LEQKQIHLIIDKRTKSQLQLSLQYNLYFYLVKIKKTTRMLQENYVNRALHLIFQTVIQ
jgi:hypothetical protein